MASNNKITCVDVCSIITVIEELINPLMELSKMFL